MLINKGQEYYLKDGALDLSILNEAIIKVEVNEYNIILEEIESIKASDEEISATLEEMAMIFEKEDEFKEAFSKERLEEEMKEFGQMI